MRNLRSHYYIAITLSTCLIAVILLYVLEWNSKVGISSEEKQLIVTQLGRDLFDPFSAQWTFDVVRGTATLRLVCGHINAKNRFGGYVGWRRFEAFLMNHPPEPKSASGFISRVPLSSTEDAQYMKICEDFGKTSH